FCLRGDDITSNQVAKLTMPLHSKNNGDIVGTAVAAAAGAAVSTSTATATISTGLIPLKPASPEVVAPVVTVNA
ncbi:hypothetical protein, partial [Pseudoteredinibacter isoporae]|uniref:hypothetical protein n=1 Tax=Pseudoteredinibacter isoporae TaxID=570281 RepID=UPI00333F38FF